MYLVIMVVLWVLFVSSAPIVVLIPAIVLLVGLIILMVSAANSAKETKKRYQARHNPPASGADRFTLYLSIWVVTVLCAFRA